ncbi:uncharacterized protein PV09_07530 [Verruconis gallopava]|uniref:Uncharacterized protein n=1 Tax=Verruconis gallopava TaxID=253628 RepID=A0A0D2A2R3_9PEZI|nr:uncharacterized protein PV09_07530 [Verruconis gallopava]KIW01013.1 hypothetical protein PV09_07530 [Verruconis gallopava]
MDINDITLRLAALTLVDSESPISPIGKLPSELQDIIFQKLSNAQLYPFLFMRRTYKSARRALYGGVLAVRVHSPRSKNFLSLWKALSHSPEMIGLARTLQLQWHARGLADVHELKAPWTKMRDWLLQYTPTIRTLDVEIGHTHTWNQVSMGISSPLLVEIILRAFDSKKYQPVSSSWLTALPADHHDWSLSLINCYFHPGMASWFATRMRVSSVVRLEITGSCWNCSSAFVYPQSSLPRLKHLHLQVLACNHSCQHQQQAKPPHVMLRSLSRAVTRLESLHFSGRIPSLIHVASVIRVYYPSLRCFTAPASEQLRLDELLNYSNVENFAFYCDQQGELTDEKWTLLRIILHLDPRKDLFARRLTDFKKGRRISLVPAFENEDVPASAQRRTRARMERFQLAFQFFRDEVWGPDGRARWRKNIECRPGEVKIGEHFTIDHSALAVLE